jgi:hypothetical protein
MDVRVITLRYSDGQQGVDEQALAQAKAGREVLEVREHFFVHGNVPHLALVLLLGDGTAQWGRSWRTGTVSTTWRGTCGSGVAKRRTRPPGTSGAGAGAKAPTTRVAAA